MCLKCHLLTHSIQTVQLTYKVNVTNLIQSSYIHESAKNDNFFVKKEKHLEMFIPWNKTSPVSEGGAVCFAANTMEGKTSPSGKITLIAYPSCLLFIITERLQQRKHTGSLGNQLYRGNSIT